MLYTIHRHNTDRKGLQILLTAIHTIFSVHGINGVSVQYIKKVCILLHFPHAQQFNFDRLQKSQNNLK